MATIPVVTGMFGFLASGKLVRTDFVQIDSTHFALSVCDAENMNYISVFLTGSLPFPDGTAGLVYISWSENGCDDDWQLLGSLSNLKPSAIFRISRPKQSNEQANSTIDMLEIGNKSVAKIGISVESAEVVGQHDANVQSKSFSNPSVSAEYGKKMLLNFYEYVSSFAIPANQISDKSFTSNSSSYIPFSALENWYRNFERKLALNPNFWKS